MSSWTQALHEYLLASPPQGLHENAVRALLCTRRKANESIPIEIADPLREWLAQSPSLSGTHALSSALPYTEDFHRMGGPLLLWGMSRPWHVDILVQHILVPWCTVLNERNLYSNALAANLAYATRLVAQLLPMLSETARFDAAQLWTTQLVETSPNNVLWQPNMYNDAVTRRNTVVSWADLHTIATTYLGSLGTEKWEHAVHRAFDKNVSHHTTHLLTLLQTPLSDNAKIRAACAVDFNVWFDPDIFAQLSPLLQRTAPEPAVRIYSLPWAKDEHIRDRQERTDLQKRLCSLYCPELVPLFELCDIDWLDRINVFRVASTFTASRESLPVAGLLDDAPEA